MIHPIIDQYYNHCPSYVRSSGFAVSKGLVSNAPGAIAPSAAAAARGLSPASGGLTAAVRDDSRVAPATDGQSEELRDQLDAVEQIVPDVGA